MYCFDTSGFIEPWIRKLPPDIFPAYWEGIERLIRSREIVSPIEVLFEIKKKQDELREWLDNRNNCFLELDDAQQAATSEILVRFPELVKAKKFRTDADPFVIALARVGNHVVVTEEVATRNMKRPNIPDVCGIYGIRCVNVVQFIREQGWVFRSS